MQLPLNLTAVINDKSIRFFPSLLNQIRFTSKRKFFPPKEKHLLLLYWGELSEWLVTITVLKDQDNLVFNLDAQHKLENTETVISILCSIFSWLSRLKTYFFYFFFLTDRLADVNKIILAPILLLYLIKESNLYGYKVDELKEKQNA